MSKTTVALESGGKQLVIETGRVARQADGAALVRYGDTVVLVTAVASKVIREGKDFLPLTVDYQEKAYAAGKIPGGYFRREGRPSEREVLTSRLIDRPIRPLFPDGYYYETQVIASVLSYGEEYVSDILGIIGASAALAVSDIPFQGPVGAVRVGRLDGRFLINPSLSQNERCDLTLIVAGTAEAVMMVEGGANEVPEETLLDAIMFAHEEIRRIVACQEGLRKEIGREKRSVAPVVLDGALKEEVRTQVREPIRSAVLIPNKTARQEALAQILEETLARMSGEDAERGKQIRLAFHELERDEVRRMILEKGLRADGRSPESIRPITCETGVMPRTHGSALFTRGETQALVVATLGTAEDEQRIETLEGDLTKTFMLHYNFPPFSVGEARPLRSPGRREIGHGALAERAIQPVVPVKTEFPYTLRIVSDILESNGSSSMATVCGATLALMDAGVPIKAPIAGIAMGLIKEGDQVVVLSDILGLEDHLGDMDFKVTGSDTGVTALQMDIKIAGVTKEIMQTALAQAREGRIYILGKMREALAAPRSTLSAHAPRIFTLQIHKDKIRDVIGTGGKVVRGIVEQTGVKIDIEDSGIISIASPDEEAARKAIAIIQGIVQEAEVGKIYVGKVKRIMDFGAFVEIFPGTEGLVHISQIAEHRVTRVSDELKEGDEILAKVLEIDKSGKIRLSRKEAMRERATAKQG
jgi:polyribonucleotide nucleotidyltransferase